jgi:hypothetical protein
MTSTIYAALFTQFSPFPCVMFQLKDTGILFPSMLHARRFRILLWNWTQQILLILTQVYPQSPD